MVTIVPVQTARQKRLFVDFQVKLYHGNPNYVPLLRADELSNFNPKKNPSSEHCDYQAFLAYKDGKIVGRIAGIVQKLYNEKVGEKRVRFTRFDSVNDKAVAKALFGAVENWAKEKGMEIVHGPLGFNDLDREGMLIHGFDEISTFEEQYNAEYYADLLADSGYEKEADWLEYQLFTPKEPIERLDKFTEVVLKRYKLKEAPKDLSNKKFIQKYWKDVFEIINEAYAPLHGTVPFSEREKAYILKKFGAVLDRRFIIGILDEHDRVVGFGFAFPSLSKALNKSKGKIFPFNIFRLIRAIENPKILDLALIGVRNEYKNSGLTAALMRFLVETMRKYDMDYAETNLILEDNYAMHNSWKYFDTRQHKRRRCYIKRLEV